MQRIIKIALQSTYRSSCRLPLDFEPPADFISIVLMDSPSTSKLLYQKIYHLDRGCIVLYINERSVYYDVGNTELSPYYLACCIVDAMFDFLCQSEPSRDAIDNGSFKFRSVTGREFTEEAAKEELLNYVNLHIEEYWSNILGFHFRVIDKLSVMEYEKAKTQTRIVVANSFFSAPYIELNKPQTPIIVNLDNCRQIRKLMAGAGINGALLFYPCPISSQKTICRGIVSTSTLSTPMYEIIIKGPFNWRFLYKGDVLFCRQTDGYAFYEDAPFIKRNELIRAITDSFNLDNTTAKNLSKNITEVVATHGASFLISDFHCEEVINRFNMLSKNRRALNVFTDISLSDSALDDKKKKMISSAASMDGAVIVNSSGDIVYVATILDGKTSVVGDPARGARYNSMKNFVKEFIDMACPMVGIVMSEDGGQDIIWKDTFNYC